MKAYAIGHTAGGFWHPNDKNSLSPIWTKKDHPYLFETRAQANAAAGVLHESTTTMGFVTGVAFETYPLDQADE